MRKLLLLACLFIFGCQIRPRLSIPALLQRNTVAVLHTISEPINDRYSPAAGTIIKRQRGTPLLILTAQHVVDVVGPFIVNIEIQDNILQCDKTLSPCIRLKNLIRIPTIPIYSDRNNDIAVLTSISNWTGEELPTTCLASQEPKVGNLTFTTGSPGRVPYIITEGRYIRKMIRTSPLTGKGLRTTYMIDTTAGYYGASGGGTFNKRGNILGINSTITWLRAHIALSPTVKGLAINNIIVPGFLNITTIKDLKPVFQKFNLCIK